MRSFSSKLLPLLLAFSLLAAACGDDEDSVASTSTSVSPDAPTEPEDGDMEDSDMEDGDSDGMATSSADPASELRAGLTSLLQEHLYLAGITIETALDAGGDVEDPSVVAASAALDENSVALAGAIGSVAGDENGEAFLGLWREHIGFFVDYTLGKATGDEAMVEQAMTDLQGYREAASAFFEEITGGAVSADDVSTLLAPHTTTTIASIDALVAGDTQAFTLLREAGQVMPDIAAGLASAIVVAVPDQFPGDPAAAPSETRAGLTHLLQEHVYLAGIAIEQAVEAGGDMENPAVVAAVATLDENSVALADVISSVAGEENGEAFLGLWREHIGFFVDYTLGKATEDEARAEQALVDLGGYEAAAGAFFEDITDGELTAADLTPVLNQHVTTVTATIDSLLAGDGQAFTLLRAAGQHMPGTAAALAAAVTAG